MAYANDIQSAHFGFADRFGSFFKTAAERYARFRVFRETQIELGQLSDRELGDLGISRATIKAVAYDAAYGA